MYTIHNVELYRRSWGLKQTSNNWPRYDSQSNEWYRFEGHSIWNKKMLYPIFSNSKSQFRQAPDQFASILSERWVPKLSSCTACAQGHAVWILQAGMHTYPTQHIHKQSLFLLAPSITDKGKSGGCRLLLNQWPWCFSWLMNVLLHTFTKLPHS